MREPEHPDITFKAGTLGRFARKHGIRAEIGPVDPLGMEEGPRIRRTRFFVVSLEIGNHTLTRMIEFLRYREVMPTVEDVLDHLLNEAMAHERLKGDVALAMRVTGWPEPQARQWLEGMASDVETTKMFFGPAAYAEFIKINEIPRE